MLPLYHALFFLFSAFFGRKLGHFRFSDSYPLAHRAVSFFLFIPLLHFLHTAAVPLLKQTRHRLVVFAAVFRQKFHDPRLGMLQVAADPVEPDFIQILVDRQTEVPFQELRQIIRRITKVLRDLRHRQLFGVMLLNIPHDLADLLYGFLILRNVFFSDPHRIVHQ